MFPYDAALIAVFRMNPDSIDDVLATMQTIENTCTDGDGLKWFNWLYFRVTKAVEARIAAGGFQDAAWLTELDVRFARLYFQAMAAALQGQPAPGCWRALMARRNQAAITRIQFALAGVNAHINHDLPLALVATSEARNTTPQYLGRQYADYTSLNSTFESLIEVAKKELRVRLLGEALPPMLQLEHILAAWNVIAARETAWHNSAVLWHLRAAPPLVSGFTSNLDGLTTVAGKALLIAL